MDQPQININIDPDKIEAKYCDQAFISHNPFGFTIDFAQQIPQLNTIKIFSRVAMSPQHAKAFLEVFAENIKTYEKTFGSIELTKQMKDHAKPQKPIGFQVDPEKPTK